MGASHVTVTSVVPMTTFVMRSLDSVAVVLGSKDANVTA